MHTVRLLLKTTAYDNQTIEKRFRAIWHIHNVLVKHAKKLLKKLKADKEYQILLCEYQTLLKKEKLTTSDKKRKKQLSADMNAVRTKIGLSEYAFQSYIKVCAKQFSKCISSQQVQKEASRVWRGVEKVLFADGKDIHFKKLSDISTICGKTNTNGVKFHKESGSVEWQGLHIKCRFPKRESEALYICESLDNDISYCEIERLMFPNGWHYYVIIYLKGDAPKKITTADRNNIAGIDIGTSTIAAVSDNSILLKELAPRCKKYNRQIEKLLHRMDISKRLSNPKKYNPDGTIKKSNRSKWVYSNTYKKNLQKLKSLYRKKSAYIKQSHEELCNTLLCNSVNFIAEEMSFAGLQKRSKTTERSDKLSDIRQKDGSIKPVYKCKKKKRFGRSLNNRAPAMLLTILERKCNRYGGALIKADARKFKASQYNHADDTYTKTTLKERYKTISGHPIQRDLYSAFLLKNSNDSYNAADRQKCLYGFDNFAAMHDTYIEEMKRNNISMKQCFGF